MCHSRSWYLWYVVLLLVCSTARASEDPVAMLDEGLLMENMAQLRKGTVSNPALPKRSVTATLKEEVKKANMSAKAKLRLQMSGCKDKLGSLCKKKKTLCHNTRLGGAVRQQCMKTCNVCPAAAKKLVIVKKSNGVSCKPKPLVKALPAKLIKASSNLRRDSGGDKARLDSLSTPWVAGKQHRGQWLQITLPQTTTITSVTTQGRYNSNQWVTYYKLMHKLKHWRWYNGGKWLSGNWDREHSKKHIVRPFKAKFLRFYPQKWHHKISMRVEVDGCVETTQAKHRGKEVKKKKIAMSNSSGYISKPFNFETR